MDKSKLNLFFSSKFLKAQYSSLISTATDFLMTLVLTQFVGIWYLLSSGIGTVSGGIINFYLGRNWVFRSSNAKLKIQVLLYVAVWTVSLALNTVGLYVLTEFVNFPYVISKSITAVLVGVFFNYNFQKSLVFRT